MVRAGDPGDGVLPMRPEVAGGDAEAAVFGAGAFRGAAAPIAKAAIKLNTTPDRMSLMIASSVERGRSCPVLTPREGFAQRLGQFGGIYRLDQVIKDPRRTDLALRLDGVLRRDRQYRKLPVEPPHERDQVPYLARGSAEEQN